MIVIFLKENGNKLFSNWVYNKFVHFKLEMFLDDPLPIHYSKTIGHVTVKFYFYKKKKVFWFQTLLLRFLKHSDFESKP